MTLEGAKERLGRIIYFIRIRRREIPDYHKRIRDREYIKLMNAADRMAKFIAASSQKEVWQRKKRA